MTGFENYEFWLIVGSQTLYGDDVLKTIDDRAKEMAKVMNKSGYLPCRIVYRSTVKSNAEISELVREANYDRKCAGVIAWCHTFSPSKMWINGLMDLRKPYCHLATQYNRDIPNEEIDMDFMNLNQAAHGDREHGFIGARLKLTRKIIAGYWREPEVLVRLGKWMRVAAASQYCRGVNVMRLGDNMREVAVTEGDKVEAQKVFGWQVNTWPVYNLEKEVEKVTEEETDALMEEYRRLYDFATDDIETVRYQAKEEIAIKRMMDREDCVALADTFQDLCGLKQLPGLAIQHLMAQGYGFGAEGDWKTSALLAVIKMMGQDMGKGTSFMEDYTYHLDPSGKYSLGAHMLEVCPSVAADKPRIEVHPLGIGDKEPPARLVFEGREGDAVALSLVDMGGRMRLICQDVHAVKPIMDMPNLPVARVMWQPKPDLENGVACWIVAGGAHHTVFSYDVDAEMVRDFAKIMGVEFVHITDGTTPEELEDRLMISDLAYRLRSL